MKTNTALRMGVWVATVFMLALPHNTLTWAADWKAKDSWVSRLPKAEMKRMLGLQDSPTDTLDFESLRSGIGIEADESLDWRNIDGVNWLGPILNQGNCGSCVAFATVAALEARTSIAWGVPWLRPAFSPQMLFSCGGGGCASGWRPASAARFLKKQGIVDEACMPYTSGSTGADVACEQKCEDSGARAMKIVDYSSNSVFSHSIDKVKAALKNGPLVTTLKVYADFMTYGSGVYKHTKGEELGGHAVSLVGYDNSKRAWLIRNSWGTEWGENGFAWVSWDDRSGVGSDYWAFEVSAPQGYLSVITPTDREFISGNYKLQARGNDVHDTSFHIKDATHREIVTINCDAINSQECQAYWDTTKYPEGRYEVSAQRTNGQPVSSQARELFIINSEPKMSLSFRPDDRTNLDKPLDGRVDFLVSAKSTSVPIEHIEFRVFDLSGRLVSVKTNDYVLESMRMGWRANTVPSGNYKISFHGETRYNGKTYSVDSNSFQVTVSAK